MDRNWFKSKQQLAGLRQSDIADLLGRSPPVVSSIINGTRPLKVSEAEKLAEAFGVDVSEVLSRAGITSARTSRALGFSESEIAPWQPEEDNPKDQRQTAIANALGMNKMGADIWRVSSAAMSSHGYLIGDYVLVDQSAGFRAKSKDVVIAQVYDWNSGTAETILRKYMAPVLVGAVNEAGEVDVRVVDNRNVTIKGVVKASWRDT